MFAHEVPNTTAMNDEKTSTEAGKFLGPEGWRRTVAGKHPRFLDAVVADARVTAAHRGERFEFRSRLDGLAQALRLVFVTDAFLAQALYRMKARCQALHLPVLPRLAHRMAIITGQVSIGDPVVVHPGIYLPHGQVVIDG